MKFQNLFRPGIRRLRRPVPNPPEFLVPPVTYKCIACGRSVTVRLAKVVADRTSIAQAEALVAHDKHVTLTGEPDPRCVRSMRLIADHYRDHAAFVVAFPDEPGWL